MTGDDCPLGEVFRWTDKEGRERLSLIVEVMHDGTQWLAWIEPARCFCPWPPSAEAVAELEQMLSGAVMIQTDG